MRTIISLILTPLFYFNFGLILGIFHIVQIIAYRLGGASALLKASECLSWSMLLNCRLAGACIKTEGVELLPLHRPLIIVSNHQTLLDIFAVVTTFRKFKPRFAAKIELGKGIPSVSYYLTMGGSALIDRDNPRQAIGELLSVGKYIEQHNCSICIYAEGSRSKDGVVRKFQSAGIATLVKASPRALIIPFAISGHAQFQANKLLQIGQRFTYTVLPPIDPHGKKMDVMVSQLEELIRQQVIAHS